MKKIIKRAAAVICGAALAATMTLSAFALPSPSVSGFVKGVQSAVDANGNAVNIIVQLVADAKFDAAEQKAVDALRANPTAELKRILGSEYKDTLQLVDIRNVKIDGDASKVKFPVTVTFDVPGVTASSEAILLHYVEKDNQWEVIHAKTGDKTIEQVGEEAFAKLLRVLSGEMTKNEAIQYFSAIDIHCLGPVI